MNDIRKVEGIVFKKESRTNKVILLANGGLLTIVVLSVLLPLVYVAFASFTDPDRLLSGGLSLDPSDWTLQGYRRVLANASIWTGFRNSLLYSASFSLLSVAITIFASYPLSRRDFSGRRWLLVFFIVTMFFNGGLIPTYLLIKNMSLLDTAWAIIVPNAVNVWNIILARAYFQTLPAELREAAIVDGASDLQYFLRILLPLSKPIIAVLALYQFVGQWNAYFDAMIYLSSDALVPLQIVLRSILVQMKPQPGMYADVQNTAQLMRIAEMVKYAVIVVASLPLLLIYPFFQKYFEKGVMVGSIKG